MSSIKPPSSSDPRHAVAPPTPAEATEKTEATSAAAVDVSGRAPETSDTSVATPSPAPSLPANSDAPRLALVFADNMAPLLADLTTSAQGGYVHLDSVGTDHSTRSSLYQSVQQQHDHELMNEFILMRLATMARTESSDDDDHTKREEIKREQKIARIKRQAVTTERRHDSNELLEMSKVSHGWPARSDLLSFVEPTVVAWATAIQTGAPPDVSLELDATPVVGPERAGPLRAPLAAATTELAGIAEQQGVSAMLTAMPAVIEQALAQAGFAPELPETQKISRALQTQVLAALFPEAPDTHEDFGLLAAVVGRTLDPEQPADPLPADEPAAVVEASFKSALEAIREWADRRADRESRPMDLLP